MFDVENISVVPDDRIKKILSEVFDQIIEKYGKNDFLRWIKKTRVDDKIKTLIVKYITIKENPNFGGYYNSNSNTLAVQESYNYDSTFKVLVHELNHFMTPENFIKEMTGFINEGITEYLAQSVDKKGYKSYKYNVDFIRFLHKHIGDILIKSYFTGETKKVKSKLETYLSPNISLESFLNELSTIYKKCYNVPHSEVESVMKSKMDFLAETYMQIYLGKITEDANAMKYYSNGNIDQFSICDIIAKISVSFPKYVVNYMIENDLMIPYKEKIVRTILNSSHLRHFDYYETDNIEQYVTAIMSQRTIEIPNNNAIQILLLDKLNNKELNINEYADIILMVISKFPKFKVEDLNKMNFLIDKIGEDKFKIIYEYVTNNINRYNNINNFVNEHERNTIESYFRVIIPNWCYLEKRDNKLYIIKLDGNGKIIKEIPVEEKYGKPFLLKDIYIPNDKGEFCKLSITLDEDFSKIKIYPEVSEAYKGVYDLDDFQKLMKTLPFIEKIREKLKENIKISHDSHEPFFGVEGVYYLINNIGIKAHDDYRTIHIDINGLKKDCDTLISFFPKKNKEKMIIDILKGFIKDIYEIDYSSEIDWCSKMLYEIMYNGERESLVLDIEGLLNHLKQEKNNFIKSKYELSFKDEVSKQEYNKRKQAYDDMLESQRIKEESMRERRIKEIFETQIKNFEDNHRYGYLIYERKSQHANPDAQFDLPSIKFPQHTREPGFASIDVERLIQNMKKYISLCKDKKDYEPYIISTIKSTINNYLEIVDTEEGKQLFDYLYTIIYNSVINDEAINMTNFENVINRSNEYISKHASLWPTEVNPERNQISDLLNNLYVVIGDTKQFQKIVKIVTDYVLANGYDENIYQIVLSILEPYQIASEEHKKTI